MNLLARFHWQPPQFIFDLRCRLGLHRYGRPFFAGLRGPWIIYTRTCESCGRRQVRGDIARAEHKGAPLEDLRKAQWYLDREINRREKAATSKGKR